MLEDEHPVRSRIDKYVNEDSYFQKFIRKAGLSDVSFTQKNAWSTVLDSGILHLTLANIPLPSEKALTASEIKARVGGRYDMSNHLKNLNNLVTLNFVEVSTTKDGKSNVYRMSDEGEYFFLHAGAIFSPRTDIQNVLIEREREVIKWKELAEYYVEQLEDIIEAVLTAKTLDDLKERVKVLKRSK